MDRHNLNGMQTRALCLIALILLVSCCAVGCTTSNVISSSNQTEGAANEAHDAVLEKFLAADYNNTAQNITISKWETKWINGTSAIVHAEGRLKGANYAVSMNQTVIRLPSVDEATLFVRSYNLTGYTQIQAAYANVTVFRVYEKTSLGSSSSTVARVTQVDDIVMISSTTVATTSPIQLPILTPTPRVTAAPTGTPTPTPTSFPFPTSFTFPTTFPTSFPTTTPAPTSTPVPTPAS